jgi:hypothetical protein
MAKISSPLEFDDICVESYGRRTYPVRSTPKSGLDTELEAEAEGGLFLGLPSMAISPQQMLENAERARAWLKGGLALPRLLPA